MRLLFNITQDLRCETMSALRRPHLFATERVAFLKCRMGSIGSRLIVFAHSLHHVADQDYVNDPSAAATMGPAAIRKALQMAFREKTSMFYVHIHEHKRRPGFSSIDTRETARFVPDFWNVQPDLPHGAIVLSQDSAWGRCWYPTRRHPIDIEDFAFVGIPMRCTWKP
jgi:hypothetical protein